MCDWQESVVEKFQVAGTQHAGSTSHSIPATGHAGCETQPCPYLLPRNAWDEAVKSNIPGSSWVCSLLPKLGNSPVCKACSLTAAMWSCYMARLTTQTALEGCHMSMHRILVVFFPLQGSLGYREFIFSIPSAWKGLEEPLRAQQYKQV